ncbi:MAG: CoA transferase [Hyphomicrobiales bacterium]|nr:CoA transferase [Hyphomicrobiales bacterium]
MNDASSPTAATSSTGDGKLLPLAGIRILDITQFLSGPFGSQIMADLGAEVIKVESPEGDLARHMPPHFLGEDSVYFHAVNRGKRSLMVDMKTPEGIAVVRRLALASDAVLENYRPGVLARLGLDEAQLRADKPDLIWCSVSGFGQDGPYRDKPAYDMIVQALSGGMSLTGEPGGTAVRSGVPIGDLAAGMYAVIGLLSALLRRNACGLGASIDISMLDCQVAMLTYQAAYHLFSGDVPGLQGTGHDSIATYRGFKCASGTQLVITANTERMWKSLCKALGAPDLADDPLFKTSRERHVNRRELYDLLESLFLTRTAEEWLPLLDAESVPVARVNTLDKVMTDPQVVHRGMVGSVTNSEGETVRVIGNPLRIDSQPDTESRRSPALGADSRAILRDVLGLDEGEIYALAERNVIAPSSKGAKKA